MTFIEAWSDLPKMLPMDARDRWAQGAGVRRLSTRVADLGNATGLIDLGAPCLKQEASKDPEIADFVSRAEISETPGSRPTRTPARTSTSEAVAGRDWRLDRNSVPKMRKIV